MVTNLQLSPSYKKGSCDFGLLSVKLLWGVGCYALSSSTKLDSVSIWRRFICTAKGCQRRVAILYSGSIYACRHCHQLAYTSQHETDYDKAARQAEKIRHKLGWDPCIFEMEGEKPKGMHWVTLID